MTAGALSVHCLEWGRAEDPTAVLVHGNGGHARWWDGLVPALVPGWHVVAPDLRGHGESDWAEPPAYRLAHFAADLEAVIGGLARGPVALVGHSMGGRITAWYAAHHAASVRGLALFDTRLNPGPRRAAAAWRAQMAGKRLGRTYPTHEAAIAAFRFVPDEADVPAPVIAHLARHAVVERPDGQWTYRFDRAVLTVDGDGGGNLLRVLAGVTCPVLVLAGATSWVMNAREREAIAREIPRCSVRVFPGGHHFLVAQPGPAGAALRAFLDALP